MKITIASSWLILLIFGMPGEFENTLYLNTFYYSEDKTCINNHGITINPGKTLGHKTERLG